MIVTEEKILSQLHKKRVSCMRIISLLEINWFEDQNLRNISFSEQQIQMQRFQEFQPNLKKLIL